MSFQVDYGTIRDSQRRNIAEVKWPMLRDSFLLATIIILAASNAWAGASDQDIVEAREHYKRGTSAFELGSYEEAIREYSAAYRLRDDPALLYNLGQANRLGNHPAEALHFFRLYLMKVPAAQNRAEVEAKIEELQKLVDQQKKTTQNMPPDSVAAPTTPTPTPASRSAVEAAPNRAVPAPTPAVIVDSRVDGAGRRKEVIGGAVAGAGLVFVAGGIVCGVLAKQAGDKLTQLDQSKQPFDYSQQQLGTTTQILEGVFIGVGAAAMIAGGTLFVVGKSERSRARRVALVPGWNGQTASVAIQGSF